MTYSSARRKEKTVNLYFSLIAKEISPSPNYLLSVSHKSLVWANQIATLSVDPLLGHPCRYLYRRSLGLPGKLSRLNTFPLPLLTFRYRPPPVATPLSNQHHVKVALRSRSKTIHHRKRIWIDIKGKPNALVPNAIAKHIGCRLRSCIEFHPPWNSKYLSWDSSFLKTVVEVKPLDH